MRLTHLAIVAAISVAFLCSAGVGSAQTSAQASDIVENVPGAERLEGRLLAPCCWAQTLDIHGSEIANSLRREIRTRLKAGEQPEVIEQSLVARYGERMRAVPDRVPLDMMGSLGWLGAAVSAGFLAFVLWQWRKRSIVGQASSSSGSAEQHGSVLATDERLESEMRRIHDS
jgi:cytochrome c-type biogenesis protein CcmH